MPKPPGQFTRADALQLLKYLSGYTIPEIANGAMIDARTLNNAMKGTYPLSDEATRKIARFLGVLPERLVEIARTREEL